MQRQAWLAAAVAGSLLAGACTRAAPPKSAANRLASGTPVQVDWTAVERALGRSGTMQPGDVYKFGLPRSDLKVTVAGVAVKPALALGSWVAFKATSTGVVAMGDLVLGEQEIEPVMATLARGGIDVTALHHHLLHDTPRVYYLHIHGAGDAVAVAQAVRAALDSTATPESPVAPPAPVSGPFGLDTATIARTLGHGGKVNGGVYHVSVARPDTIRDGDLVIPAAMGVATALNFEPLGGGQAAVTGDFVLRARDVDPVLMALRGHGIDVTALHNHMLEEVPRLFFMHFWAVGDASTLASGLRAALDQIGR